MHSLLPFSIALVAAVGTLVTFAAASHGEGLPNDGKPLYFLSAGFALAMLYFARLGLKQLREDIARGFRFETLFPDEPERAEFLRIESKRFALHALGNGLAYTVAGVLGMAVNMGNAQVDAQVAFVGGISILAMSIVASLVSLSRNATNFAYVLVRFLLISVVALLVALTLLILIVFLAALAGWPTS